ncbi:MAG: AAA family ATPase [Tissierellia bacterium]|nr:AAA family ATPase [Tissierellia bacterium]
MKIAVLSGKGGTGKTFLSVNLAAVAKKSIYLDCDVEEPNGYLFLKPVDEGKKDIKVLIPVVDEKLCNGCKKCVDFCAFNALAYTGRELMIFEKICHSCGGCKLVCPEKALSEKERAIGRVKKGRTGEILVYTGILNPGEASGTMIIDALLEEVKDEEGLVFIDAPPGSACVVMESIKDADYCILVAEPSIFGVHNLEMVHELVELFKKPFGVVLNKCTDGENPSEIYCLEKDIKVLGKIPFSYELGALTSAGEIVANKNKEYYKLFSALLKEVQDEAAAHS